MDNDPFVNAFKQYVNKANTDDGSESDSDYSVVTTPSDPRSTPLSLNFRGQNLSSRWVQEAKKQIVIFNVDEPDGRNTSEWNGADEVSIRKILALIEAPLNFTEFHRLGKHQHNRCRRIVVTFPTPTERDNVLAAAGKIFPIPGWSRVNIQAFRTKEEKYPPYSSQSQLNHATHANQQPFSSNRGWKQNAAKPMHPVEGRYVQPSFTGPRISQPTPVISASPVVVDPEKEELQRKVESMEKRLERMAELLEKQHEMQMKQSDATQHYEGKINPTKTSEQQHIPQHASFQHVPANYQNHQLNTVTDTQSHVAPSRSDIGYQQSAPSPNQTPNHRMNASPSYPHTNKRGVEIPHYRPGVPNFSSQLPSQTYTGSSFQNYSNPSTPFPGAPNLQHSNISGLGQQQPTPVPDANMIFQMMSMLGAMQAQNANHIHSAAKAEDSSDSGSESESSTDNESDSDGGADASSERIDFENPFRQTHNHSGSKKTLNILVLGETGVGKSTWINGIANYMSFDTLKEALDAPKPICLIASKFSVYETNEVRREVVLEPSDNQDRGDGPANEVFSDQGQSATQEPKTYQFETARYIVNIIDTPGIGDTRGPSQDKENTRKILSAISNYQDLHAICFLFKANEARMTQSFRYCIGELLLQLHKDAIDNIIFFFTNARGTFYKPGDTMTPLSEFLSQLQKERGLKISLGTDKICCTDNEAFRLVCAHYNGVSFSEEDFKNFAGSWKKSAAETHRFLEFAARQKPHNVADTISINKARTIIYYLAKPLADVNELIESNIKVFDDRKKDLLNTANDLAALKQKSQIQQIGIQVKQLDYPKTVCTGPECIETQKLPNTEQLQTIYKQVCHEHCYLNNVDPEKFPEPALRGCTAMGGSDTCHVCHCMWSTHMHIRFDQIKTSVAVEDINIKNAMKTNSDAAVTKQKMIDDCEAKIKELKAEQQRVIKTSLKFGSFLQANAILPYNDAFEKYVEQTVEEEEKCTKVGGDRSKLDNLKKLLAEYRQEKALLDQAAQNPVQGVNKKISTDEIDKMKKDLFQLKHTGKTLENLFTATGDGIAKHVNHITVRYQPPPPRSPPQWRKSQNEQKSGRKIKQKKQEKIEKPAKKGKKTKKGKKHK